MQCIDKARDIMDTDLTAMAGESYQRAYGAMVNVQMLSELEEVIQYKLVPERREAIKQMWWDRLQVRCLCLMHFTSTCIRCTPCLCIRI